MKKYALIATLALVLAAVAAHAQTQRVVTGTLVKVAAIGAETPGWAVELDEPLTLDGQTYTRIEVYGEDIDMTGLEGRRVTATGSFVQWRTTERGKFAVLELCEINPLK